MFPTALPSAAMLRVDREAKTLAPVSVANNLSVAILPVTIGGLAASSRYYATIGVRATIYRAGTTTAARTEIVQDVYITTDGSGVATCVFQHAAIVDRSKVTSMSSAQLSMAVTAGGVTVTAYHAVGVACLCNCTVRLVDLELIT